MENVFRLDASNVRVLQTVCQGSVVVSVEAIGELRENLERASLMGWSVGKEGAKNTGLLAARLTSAILAGVAFGPAMIRRDVNNKRYVCADPKVFGRHLNADLKKLGF